RPASRTMPRITLGNSFDRPAKNQVKRVKKIFGRLVKGSPSAHLPEPKISGFTGAPAVVSSQAFDVPLAMTNISARVLYADVCNMSFGSRNTHLKPAGNVISR
ncbi:hypothetical protein, partial [Roseibium sp. RKSG952]|uniref:hypothetical protein n=1 Tax=Roseibium sp. RKSG952 TaxID=2529384 RepID=UPI001AD942EB